MSRCSETLADVYWFSPSPSSCLLCEVVVAELTNKELISDRKTSHKHKNKDPSRYSNSRWHSSKYKEHKFHQREIPRFLLLCLGDVFPGLINSLVCWFWTGALGILLFEVVFVFVCLFVLALLLLFSQRRSSQLLVRLLNCTCFVNVQKWVVLLIPYSYEHFKERKKRKRKKKQQQQKQIIKHDQRDSHTEHTLAGLGGKLNVS